MQAFQGSAGPTSQQPENHSLLQQQQQQQQQPEGGQQHGHQQQPWSGQVQQGFEHPGLLQLQQQFHHQQQMQHQLMLGAGHANLAPLVGQQISQLSSLVGGHASQQSPPGLGHNNINVMLAQQQHGGQVMFPAGAGPAGLHQSPPSSTGGFLLLPNHGQQRPGDSGGSPNSTPGLQTPTPAATPPIMNLGMDQERGGLFLQGGPGGRVMQLGQHELQQELAQADFGEQMMAWRGLQALSGGTLADMFPPMDRGMPGMGMGGPGGQAGFNNFTMAMAQAAQAQQAQENMMRLQQAGEFGPHSKQFGMPGPGNGGFQPQFQPREFQPPPQVGPPHSQEMGRGYQPPASWQQAPPTQSPPPGSFSLPPGPRPRPVGGDSSPPGFHPDTLAPPPPKEDQLVIGSWNDECEKETVPPAAEKRDQLDMSLPPPGHDPRPGEWGGNFQAGRRGSGRPWQTDPAPEESNRWGGGAAANSRESKPERGGRGGGFDQRGRGRGGRGRGGHLDRNMERPNADQLVQEKADGKNSAIEETKAMMAKMRLEEKQMANKFRKEKGLPELDETEKAAPTFTRQRRGRDDRKDGARGQRGGRGRGRGAMPPPGPVPIPPQMMGGMGGMGQMGGMGPFVPGDFRTPPFPGLEGFFPPPGFPHNFAPGFPPGMLPGGFPGDLMARGRGGFPRGGRGGPPAGFPPRGLAPPFIGGRGGGRGGRGGRGGPPGAYGRPRGEEPCFNIGGEEGKGEDGEGEGAEQDEVLEKVEIVDQEPIIEQQQLQQVPVQAEQQVAVGEDEKVQAVVEAVAALGVGEEEE